MNLDTACNCCPPASCDACAPQCSSADPYVMIRAERPLKSNFVCSTKNCNVFGGHDANPMPEYQCCKKTNKIKDEDKNSLGSPIGLVASNVNFKTEGKTSDIIQARYATYLKAFARLHLNAETSWNSLVIDDIMKEGLILYSYSQKGENNMESPPDIYTPNEVNVLREFELSDFGFHVELMQPFKLNTSASLETGAKGDGVDLTLEDLMATLKSFFRQHKYGLLTVGSFYAMIWRSTDAYFIFDVCGRRVADFQTDKDKGVAMLICLSSLENLRHLLVNLSGLQVSDPVTIREIKVVKVITPSGAIMQKDYGKRTHQYQVINDDYAYLRSALHLTLNRRDLVRNRSALPVALAAIVVSKIDHPATWNMQMLDKIICFGVNFCQTCWANCRARDIIDVTEFPTYFTMGQFQITNEIMAHKYEGTWRCVPGFKHSVLAHAIKKAFQAGEQKLLVQINYQIYAIWKKHDFIYLLDPYRHRILGKPSESEVYEQMEKSATVRMFGSFEVFMNVFNHILLDSNRTSQFFIHIVKVKNIQTRQTVKDSSAQPVEDTKLDSNGEIISINEHICFEEGEDLCRKALGEISDYEDEDLKSDVVEIELRTSSSEAEVMEEEEAGAGELEEMEGLETSSSGEEGSGHKKKTQSGKGKGNKGKSKGKGSKHKGGSGKGKKGQGAKDTEEGGGKKRKKNNEDSGESSEEEASKSKKSRKVKTKEGNEKTNKKDRNQKNKGGDQQETDNENKTKDDKATADDKSKQAKTKQEKEDIDKNRKDKDGKDKDGKDKDGKDNDVKDHKDKAGKDKDVKDKNKNMDAIAKGQDDEENVRKQLKENEDRGNKNLVKNENEMADKKHLNKDEDLDKNKKDSNKETTLGQDKDKNDSNKENTLSQDKDKKDSNKEKTLGQDKVKKDSNKETNLDQDKYKKDANKEKTLSQDQGRGLGKDADNIDPNLARDKTEQDKVQSKTDANAYPNLTNDNVDPSQDKSNLDKTDKNVLKGGGKGGNELTSISPDGHKKSQPTEQPDDGKNKPGLVPNKDEDTKHDSDQAKGSNKENVRDKDPNKPLDKHLSGDKTKDIEKPKQDLHKDLNENKMKDKLNPTDQLNKDLKQKATKDEFGHKNQRGGDHSQLYDDGTEADDENEDFFKKNQRYCSMPNPNRYPGYYKYPADMAVVGSESGSYASICKLFQAGFKMADRLLTMTPWGNFVIFRCSGKSVLEENHYFLFDGCTCNFDRFRHFDLSVGTAGLICFKHIHNVIEYIRHLRKSRRRHGNEQPQYTADDICRQYCSRIGNLRV
ncbi:uncharacterized protein ms(3)76Cc [Calliphora vicina]|uniref:uncharacterized protein ms(3)76Cc n=1 Tax=Calliphora vicina TaxID=7373 RepID=UPI00325BA15D